MNYKACISQEGLRKIPLFILRNLPISYELKTVIDEKKAILESGFCPDCNVKLIKILNASTCLNCEVNGATCPELTEVISRDENLNPCTEIWIKSEFDKIIEGDYAEEREEENN